MPSSRPVSSRFLMAIAASSAEPTRKANTASAARIDAVGLRCRSFLKAQGPVYAQALVELRAGEKRTHWMWFIFPQLAGLGHSPTAKVYAFIPSP